MYQVYPLHPNFCRCGCCGMGVSWPAVEAALRTDTHRLPPALLADVQQHLEGLVFGPASQQPLNLSWSPPRFACAASCHGVHDADTMHTEHVHACRCASHCACP